MSKDSYKNKLLNIMNNCPVNLKASSPSKISSKSNCSFNLPPVISCPGATQACEGCYAIHKRSLFSNVIKRNYSNWLALQEVGDNVQEMANKLLAIIPKSAKNFRIHSAGDFFSQNYIDAWALVIAQKPDIKFWAYTRSFGFGFENIAKLENFVLFASTDSFNVDDAKSFVAKYRAFGVRHAYGPWDKNDSLPENTIACPVTSKKLKTEGACESCKLCLNKSLKKHILFFKH